MSAISADELQVRLTVDDARTARAAGVTFARTLSGAHSADFAWALAEQRLLVERAIVEAGHSFEQARLTAQHRDGSAGRVAARGCERRIPAGDGVTGPLRLKTFPGALYDGDGTLLAGDGPEMTDTFAEELPHKALIRDTPGDVEIAVLEKGDRLWVLPESFGTPPVLPTLLLTDLAHLVRRGCKVGLAAQERTPYEQARDALVLLLDDSGGQA